LALSGAPVRAGGAQSLHLWPVQVGQRPEQGKGESSWARHRDQGRERVGFWRAAAVPVLAHAARGGGLERWADGGGNGTGGSPVPGERAVLYAHCVQIFREGLTVGNVVVRLVQAHD